jgi:transposase
MAKATIGIDVSKDHLEVHRLPDGAGRRFVNDRSGYRALIKWLARFEVERVVFEPTGPYHRRLEQALAAAALPVAKVNPRQARRFAEAIGRRAKTDRVDAAMLARFGALLKPEPDAPPSERLGQLKELVLARRALIKDRTAAKNRSKHLGVALLKRQNAQRLHQTETQLAAIDKAIDSLIASDHALQQRHRILISIPGISAVTAAVLLIEMPELGTLDQKQAACLAGLAPITRQSGTWRGRARIQGGRAHLRQALYMPALVAARFNPNLKDVFKRLTAAGKPAKIAITAVMRKLLVLANALLRDHRK